MPDPYSFFGVQAPASPLGAFFPQQQQDDPLYDLKPQRSPLPPEYALAARMPNPQGFLDQVNRFKTQAQSDRLIKGLGDLDFGAPDYAKNLSALIAKNPLGAENPAVRNILNLKSLSSKQAQDKSYGDAASKALKGLYGLRPDDADYEDKLHALTQDLPDEVFQNPRFASTYERALHNADMIRSKKTADQQEKVVLAKEARRLGINPSKYDNLDDLNDAVAEHMQRQGQRKEFFEFFQHNPEFRKEYASALSKLRAPTSGPEFDQEKADIMGKDIKQMTPQDWINADALAKQRRLQTVRALNDQMMLMGVSPLQGIGKGDSEGETQVSYPEGGGPPVGTPAPPVVTPASQPIQNVTPTVAPEIMGPPQNVQERIEAEKAKAANELVKQAQAQEADRAVTQAAITAREKTVTQMAPAWQSIMAKMLPTDLQRPLSDFADDSFLVDRKINPNEKLPFTDANGKALTMRDALAAFVTSPQFEALKRSREPVKVNGKNVSSVTPAN